MALLTASFPSFLAEDHLAEGNDNTIVLDDYTTVDQVNHNLSVPNSSSHFGSSGHTGSKDKVFSQLIFQNVDTISKF